MKSAGEDYWKAAKKCTTMYAELRKEAEDAWAQWSDIDCSEYAENGN